MKRFALVLVTVAAAMFILLRARQLRADNLLINGSFETYSVPPANWTIPNVYDLNIGANNLSGWTVIQNIDFCTPNYWQVYGGGNSLDLCGTPGDGGVSQTFSTVPGMSYDVRFFLSGNPTLAHPLEPTNKMVLVTAAGQSANFTFDVAAEHNTLANMKWQQCDLYFTANAASTTLSFNATMGADYYQGPAIANVSVSSVPEPSTFALLGIGALGLVGYGFRRRWQNRVSPSMTQPTANGRRASGEWHLNCKASSNPFMGWF